MSRSTLKEVTERPILFSGEMVKVLLDGRKTQTRRVMKPQPSEGKGGIHPSHKDNLTNVAAPYFDAYCGAPKTLQNPRGMGGHWCWWTEDHRQSNDWIKCPYGVPGERLWVKEAHYLYGRWRRDGMTKAGKQKWRFVADKDKGAMFPNAPPAIVCKGKVEVGWFKRTSMFMPRWASRITLEIESVRVERVQDITAEDAIREGISESYFDCPHGEPRCATYTGCFHKLWDSINGQKEGGDWASNPWCWVLSFKVL